LGSGFLDLCKCFCGCGVYDINRTTCDAGIVEIGSRVSGFGECRRAIVPRSHVRPSGGHQTLLKDASDLPVLAMEQSNGRRAELRHGSEDVINATIIERVSRPGRFPWPLHLQVQLEGADAMLSGEVRDLCDMLVRAENRRQEVVDRRAARCLIIKRHRSSK